MNIAETLAAVSNLEDQEQLEAFGAVGEELTDSKDPAHVDAVLAFLERCGHQEGYGGFHDFECYLEGLPKTPELRKKVQDAFKRSPNYQLLQIIDRFTNYREAQEIWAHLEANSLFDEEGPRSDRPLCKKDFVRKTLFEFKSEGDDQEGAPIAAHQAAEVSSWQRSGDDPEEE